MGKSRYSSSATSGELRSTLAEAQNQSVRVPDVLHFVWIGDCSRADFSYLPVWQRFNPGLRLEVWSDPTGNFCQHFQQCLRIWSQSHPELTLCALQNKAFDFIYSRILGNVPFSKAASEFLDMNGITSVEGSEPQYTLEGEYLPENVVIRDILTLFEAELRPFKKIYYYELILRGNMASASDIVRLMILYRHGGVYIDLDTLPEINNLFICTGYAERDLGFDNDERICLAKSAAFIAWFNNHENPAIESERFINQITEHPEHVRRKLSLYIHRDINNIRKDDLKPLGEIFVHPDMLLIGAVRFLPGIFYNNMLCSAPDSRLVMLILKCIARNYRYLERSGILLSPDITVPDGGYKNHLCGYRYTFDNYSDPVTLSLTGPGVIIGTIIGLIYRLLPGERHRSPDELGILLQGEKAGLTINKQTIDTPMGIK